MVREKTGEMRVCGKKSGTEIVKDIKPFLLASSLSRAIAHSNAHA